MSVLLLIPSRLNFLSYTLRKKIWLLAIIRIQYLFFSYKNFVVFCFFIVVHSRRSRLSLMFGHKNIFGIYSNRLLMFIFYLLSVVFNTKSSMLSICVKRIIFRKYIFQFIKTWRFLVLNKPYKSVKLKTLMMITLTNYQSLSDLLWLLHRFL